MKKLVFFATLLVVVFFSSCDNLNKDYRERHLAETKSLEAKKSMYKAIEAYASALGLQQPKIMLLANATDTLWGFDIVPVYEVEDEVLFFTTELNRYTIRKDQFEANCCDRSEKIGIVWDDASREYVPAELHNISNGEIIFKFRDKRNYEHYLTFTCQNNRYLEMYGVLTGRGWLEMAN